MGLRYAKLFQSRGRSYVHLDRLPTLRFRGQKHVLCASNALLRCYDLLEWSSGGRVPGMTKLMSSVWWLWCVVYIRREINHRGCMYIIKLDACSDVAAWFLRHHHYLTWDVYVCLCERCFQSGSRPRSSWGDRRDGWEDRSPAPESDPQGRHHHYVGGVQLCH